MDFKINLPSEDCTCDARVFYDKYRKQVDNFIQNELEIAKTSKVVIGKKARKKAKSALSSSEGTSVLSDYGESSLLPAVSLSGKSSALSKKSSRRKVRLPKIKGAKYKGSKKGDSKSVSVSTITTETHLPEIKVTKKWSDELSSSSSDLMQFKDGDQEKDTILPPSQKEIDELQFEEKRKIEEPTSSSSKAMQLLSKQKESKKQQKKPKPQQKEISKVKLKKRMAEKDEFYSSSSDFMKLIDEDTQKKPKLSLEEEIGELLFKKEQTERKLSSSSSDAMQLLDRKKQKEFKSRQKKIRKLEPKKKKDAEDEEDEDDEVEGDEEVEEDELSSSSSEELQLTDYKQKKAKPLQKATSEILVKKKIKPKVEFPSSSYKEIIQPTDEEKQKETQQLQKATSEILVIKKKKSDIEHPSKIPETYDIEFKKKEKVEVELSTSSSEISQVIDENKQKETKLVQETTGKIQVKTKKKSEVESSSSSSEEIIKSKDQSKQKETKPRQKVRIKKSEVETSSSSSEEITKSKDESKQKETKPRQKVIDEKHLVKKRKSEYKHAPRTSGIMKPSVDRGKEGVKLLQIEKRELQLRKKKKSLDFISVLRSKAKKEGLDDDFITNMLAQAKEAGQEEDLLVYLSNANDEGKLHSVLFTMSEVIEKGEFEEFAADLVKEGKEIKRKNLLLKLMNNFKSDQKDENYMASLIVKAREEDPDDELLLILSKAVEENNLNSLISNIYQAKKQGQLNDMVEILLIKGKRERTKQLLSLVNTIAHELGTDSSFVEELLSEAKKNGQMDELLSELMRAKSKGTLDELISSLVKTNISPAKRLSSIIKPKEVKPDKKDYSSSLLDDVFDDDFLAAWFANAKTKKEEQLLLEKLSEVIKSGKHIEFNALAQEENVENIDDLFTIFDEVISDNDNEIDVDVPVTRDRRQKLVRPRRKPLKKTIKPRKRMVSIVEPNLDETGSAILLLEEKNRKMSRLKKHILFKRQYSITLPDVNYDLVKRQTLSSVDSTDSERSDEEEHVYEQKLEKKKSKQYRESFLKKIYGGRPIRPARIRDSDSTASSTSDSTTITIRRRLPKKKPHAIITEKEKLEPSPRKVKRNIVKYVKKKPIFSEMEFSDDSEISSYEDLLEQKISKMCDISGEERSERGYLVGFRYKDDEETIDWRKKPKKKTSFYTESFYTDEWVSRTRRRAIIYCNARKIEDLFHFLGTHLISDKPEDPIDYLIMLLEECIHFRSGIGRAPILFEQYHVESLYDGMDIFNEGFISLDQYRTGMETLFIKEFKKKPRTNNNNMVLKETFVFEALKRQQIQLRNMLRGKSVVFSTKENSSSTLGSVWSKIELYHEG